MTTTIKITQLRQALAANVVCGLPTLIRSHPGIGKTQATEQVYEKFKDKFPGGFFVLSTTEFNALDVGGLYQVQDGKTIRCPAGFIPLDKPVFILIDEFGDCPAHEQSGWYRLINNHVLGEHKLAKGSYVCAASNRPEDAAASGEISSAFISRCSVIDLRADWESVVTHGVELGWHGTILWFLRAFGRDVINNGFDSSCKYAGSTPRDFEHLNRLETCGVISKKDTDLATAQIVSVLGTKSGLKYHAFRSIPAPDVKPVFDTPKTAPIPESIEEQCIYGAAIIGAATAANFAAITTYLLRCDRVMGFGLGYDLARRLPAYKNSPSYVQFALKYKDLV